ncbi:MAG: FkbM family methyltransferase [Syntrophales bacterium]|jgi:FkbM family methyltransferase|nr:FkbM family methyltransferase [Syntrophales bacterium]
MTLKDVQNVYLKLFKPNEYRRKTAMMEFYSTMIGGKSLCFDVGANIGNRTDIFLKLGASVIAIEPQDRCMKILRGKYKNNKNVVLIQQALGDREHQETMMVCDDEPTISSFSSEWINRVKSSGRFADCTWGTTTMVSITTLDKLIDQYGVPDFIKIDVEGYEYKVLQGLSRPVPHISFEFVQEIIEPSILSIQYLSSLGMKNFNYSIEESMKFALDEWIGEKEICEVLTSLPGNMIFGDVYSRGTP